MSQKQSNYCLIDYLRCSISDSNFAIIADVLGIPISEFSLEIKGSPYPTYDKFISFANIKLHFSENHNNILIDMSGQGCRQYEEYMSRTEGWHWQRFISAILDMKGRVSRIDLALDIFDNSTPSVKTLQDYVKRGQLSTKSHSFMEINSGRTLDGKITGSTLYVGRSPQILRVYDKKQERLDNADEIVDVKNWVRWELELTGKKAIQVAFHLSNGYPLNSLFKGILSAHYAFKTQSKGIVDCHNKSRLPNMKWWDKFLGGIEAIPLKVQRDKLTLKQKKKWLEKSTAKSLSMIYQTFELAYGKQYAQVYLNELVENGKEKILDSDRTLIEQRLVELLNEEEY
ncbi:MAG: replication initiation factor domain-containing protein [Clostridium tyrobutyricum]|jgi:phage replication initiation protein|uniref:replication initiation factor domain-containing protein n=1 Tax=Clostridium tyrobutyricum TaxID=1519 RepID=UPI00242DC86F|nr:replication initiation factor domain-containing protein [Clostridium tyrobutyricum]MCH4201200.1 replication initiation factor domain-containing protein [Clostridium tyrobutyricum]MCH4237766.1 replication initiation factor domain-containing protein [Clostridium tyrobutyricum]MCH4259417.1 replication initiation factor domain-containing protein [Clostridium tyrobutyricum]MCI1653692.1 replication initiation factor domain-containing protein [Clostridium tyrobutyricum]MCI1937826.1 replication ini